jgi:hypothetical protein
MNDTIVGYYDLPSKPPKTVGEEQIDHNQRSFWCGTAGVRMDLLGPTQATRVFQELLFQAYSDALSQGYEFVRAAAPWEHHPYLPRPFDQYAGLTVKPFEDDKGAKRFLLEGDCRTRSTPWPRNGRLTSRRELASTRERIYSFYVKDAL